MAILDAGLLWKVYGVVAVGFYRRTKSGETIVVPRARRDANTPAQIECRRRFKAVTQFASSIYLIYIKRLWVYYGRPRGPIGVFTKHNLDSWLEITSWKYFQLGPASTPFFYTIRSWRDPITNELYFTWPTSGWPNVSSDAQLWLWYVRHPRGPVYYPNPAISFFAGEYRTGMVRGDGDGLVMFYFAVADRISGNQYRIVCQMRTLMYY